VNIILSEYGRQRKKCTTLSVIFMLHSTYYLKTHLNGCTEVMWRVNGVKGEDGAPVYTSMEERGRADRSVREYGFNMIVSDKIAMNRTIPDTRMPESVMSLYCSLFVFFAEVHISMPQ